MSSMQYRRVLTIAGSDSGGGAGIQADLKTFAALGCYGMSVVTAVTAQNTCAVTAIHSVPAEVVSAQIDAVLSDIGADAVKIGMLGSIEAITTVATALRHWRPPAIVVDPVMVAKSGDRLLDDDAVAFLRATLLPLATVITPNLPEAESLLGHSISPTRAAMEQAAVELLAFGGQAVVLKGGHLAASSTSPDCVALRKPDGSIGIEWLDSERIATSNTHGTGCTFSSAIAAGLARGLTIPVAIRQAKDYLTSALVAGVPYAIGKGHGPVHHFWSLWPTLDSSMAAPAEYRSGIIS